MITILSCAWSVSSQIYHEMLSVFVTEYFAPHYNTPAIKTYAISGHDMIINILTRVWIALLFMTEPLKNEYLA